jgi:hypothetical protein
MQGALPEHDHDLYLGPELHDIYNTPFWYSFVTRAEEYLAAVGVESRGLAAGDLALPGCRYASLRNEAYVRVPTSPPGPRVETSSKSCVGNYPVSLNNTRDDEECCEVSSPLQKEHELHQQEQEQEKEEELKAEAREEQEQEQKQQAPATEEEKAEHHASPLSCPAVNEAHPPPYQLVYPPNASGWNAARHPNPFLEVIFFLRERRGSGRSSQIEAASSKSCVV